MARPDRLLVRVTAQPLSLDEATAFIADPGAGGSCVFFGTVRDHGENGVVTGLTYEAWEEIALRRLDDLGNEAFDRWSICKVAILHRFGTLAVGETSVVVAVSAAHRAEAFDACRYAIEQLKHDIPIWKKELLASGESNWVMGA